MARRMLADELGDMLNPAPRNEPDPDAVFGDDGGLLHGSDDELARHLDDLQPSQLRVRASIELDGEDYRGRPSSRAALFGGGGGGDDDFGLGLDLGFGDGGGVGDDGEEGGEAPPRANGAAASAAPGGGAEASEGSEGEEGEEGGSGSDEDGGGGSDSDGGAPEEAGVRPAGGHGARSGGGGGGAGGDAEEEGSEEEEGRRGGMMAALARYQQDPEMDDLERQHAALQQQAGAAAAERAARGGREAAKARAVRAQRTVWERALEARILLQRPVAGAARLPRPGPRAAAVAASGDVRQGYADLLSSCQETLDQLLDLHGALLQRHPQAAAAAAAAAAPAPPDAGGRKRGRGAEGGGGGAAAAWAAVEAAVAAAAPFRDGSLDKWHRRTVLSSGAAALRGSGGLRALQQSVTVQVASLMRDGPRLAARTQLPRALAPRPLCSVAADAAPDLEPATEDATTTAATATANGGGERDPETFDDGEFYQQLLKELLEAGAAGPAGAAAAARPPKRRKAVDRRASKGRKLRYSVMDKLVGFCAPAELAPPPFAAQLFGNLFGGGGRGGA
ncbi:MAG: apoptosis antagonizing transcription factor-domain-containing protein [Monoraphidium minutum]|nr:MAG: apoptosis antagonizing transcription factor-domain-containing protein [Monoraphidium minutum]